MTPEAGKLLLFGGRDDLGANLDDTWAFDPLAGTWTDLHPATSPPGGGQYGGMVYDPDAGHLLLLSMGQDGNGSPEVWSFDFAGSAWSKLKTIEETPPSRKNPSVVWAEDIGLLLMIGGVAPEGAANDVALRPEVWRLDATGETAKSDHRRRGPRDRANGGVRHRGQASHLVRHTEDDRPRDLYFQDLFVQPVDKRMG